MNMPARRPSAGALVTDSLGRHGRINEGPPTTDGERFVQVEFGRDGPRLLLPEDLLEPRDDGSFHFPMDAEALAGEQVPSSKPGAGHATVVPLAVEQVRVDRRRVATGRVRVRKVVREEEAIVDEPLTRTRAEIEHKPVNTWVEDLPPIRTENDTVIIPVVEEVLVVTRRLRLVEEIHVSRRQETFHAPQRVTLRREEAVVERLSADRATNGERSGEEPAERTAPPDSGPAV